MISIGEVAGMPQKTNSKLNITDLNIIVSTYFTLRPNIYLVRLLTVVWDITQNK